MKRLSEAFRVKMGKFSAALIVILLTGSVIHSNAQTYTISVADSSLQVNLGGGITGWTVNGVNQLANQWFYYTSGGLEYPINTLSSPSAPVFGGTSFGGVTLSTNVSTTYANSSLSLTTKYSLAQQGNGAALSTTITLQNTSASSETLQFYQLSDFTLGGISSGQSVNFLETTYPFGVTQAGGGLLLNGSLSGVGLGTSVPVEEVAGTGNFGLGNGNTAPTFSDSPLSATGNVAYAYEFNVTLAGNSGITISELQAVPEPSSMALLGLGIIGLGISGARKLNFSKK